MICKRCKKEFVLPIHDINFKTSIQYFLIDSIDLYCRECLFDLNDAIGEVACHFENEEI